MNTEKSVGISFRVTPKLKRLLEAAAVRERRSLTNMLEVLVEEYCIRHGIEDIAEKEASAGRSSGKSRT